MNDKKDYTEKILSDGTIYRYYKSGKAFLRYRTKKSLDFAEEELRRSLNVILNDIRKFKSAIKNIKTEKDQEELLLQIGSSLATINKLLDDEPLLKEYVSDIKIDEKLLREFGYSPNAFEVMRERSRINLETFQKELLELKDKIMNIDFTNISPLQKTVENSKPSKEQQENSSNEYKFEEDFLNELFKKCEYHFKCSYREFVEAMSKANFNKIIQRKGCKKSYCYAFIAIIGKINHDWYNNVFNNLKGIDGLNIKELKDISKYIRKDNSWQNQIKKILMKYYEI